MQTAREVVCHVHDPVKAPLLRGAVLPAVAGLPAGVQAHVERGWRHGPHILVALGGAEPAAVDAAATVLQARLQGYLRDHPSSTVLTGHQLLRMSEAAGRAELLPPPYGPFAADNSVTIRSVEPPEPGGPLALRARLLHDGTPALAALLDEVGSSGDTVGARVRATVVALTAFATADGAGLSASRIGYESHLAAHRHVHDPAGAARSRHRAVWQTHRAELRTLVRDVGEGGGGPLAQAWRSWERAARAATAAAPTGALVFRTWADNRRDAAAFADPEVAGAFRPDDMSLFHQAIVGWRPEGAARHAFDCYRFGVNVLYLLLAVADVSPAERVLACSLVCDTVTDLTGLDWRAELHRDGRVPHAGSTATQAVSR